MSNFEAISAVGHFTARPGAGSAKAFSRIGYELSEALADLIDNSIEASASRVEITFFRDDERITAVTTADNGRGMNETKLHEAMQFAAPPDHKATDLGVFGLGMKAASLSQSSAMTVITKFSKQIRACRWTVESIKHDWTVEVLDASESAPVFNEAFSEGFVPTDSGTVIFWDRLDRLSAGSGEADLDEFLEDIVGRLQVRLGLVFHRFLGSRLDIVLRVQHVGRRYAFPRSTKPLDPFGYYVSGDERYPRTFTTQLPDVGPLTLVAHIWPPGAVSDEFQLGQRNGTRGQGFYFYRNDRLIQAGGWNNVVSEDRDLSLARIKVDLPPSIAVTNVQKSQLQVTAALTQALQRAQHDNKTLKTYFEDARRVFAAQSKKKRGDSKVPFVMGKGVGWHLRKKSRGILASAGIVREVDFDWEILPDTEVFYLDRVDLRIVLNKRYRREILNGSAASAADAPLVKSLIFLLVREELDRMRSSAKSDSWLELCNSVLFEAIKNQ